MIKMLISHLIYVKGYQGEDLVLVINLNSQSFLFVSETD